jgi:hypothetical protein
MCLVILIGLYEGPKMRSAMADVLNALDPQHPVHVPCVPVVPGIGG